MASKLGQLSSLKRSPSNRLDPFLACFTDRAMSLTPFHFWPEVVSTTSLSQPDVQLHQDGHGHEPLPVEGLPGLEGRSMR